MISGIFVKILSIVFLMAVGVVLILGIGTLFKGGETSKKYSNKLMQYRVLLQFIAIILLIIFAYFFNEVVRSNAKAIDYARTFLCIVGGLLVAMAYTARCSDFHNFTFTHFHNFGKL